MDRVETFKVGPDDCPPECEHCGREIDVGLTAYVVRPSIHAADAIACSKAHAELLVESADRNAHHDAMDEAHGPAEAWS